MLLLMADGRRMHLHTHPLRLAIEKCVLVRGHGEQFDHSVRSTQDRKVNQ